MKKRAILIASSDFSPDSGIETLRFPVNDVNAMEDTLRSEDFNFEVKRIINEYCSDVKEKLEKWISEADYEDLLLIYFSGHGKLNRGRELFLSCANTRDTSLNATGLEYRWLMNVVHDHSVQSVAVILDCCYAGRAIAGSRGTARGAIEEQVRAAVAESAESGQGYFFLGASGANQTAEEREQDGYGRFTRQIIDGLSSGDADIDDDGKISAKDLATYVKSQLRRQNASQEPIEGGGYQGELILGCNRRKQLKAALSTIQESLWNKWNNHFTRETFRNIEDYLDQVQKTLDIRVFEDPKFLILKKLSLRDAKIEEVAKVFWSTSVGPDLPAGGAPETARPLPLNVGSPPPSQPPTEAQEQAARPQSSEEPKTDTQSESPLATTAWDRMRESTKQQLLTYNRHRGERAAQRKQHRAERAAHPVASEVWWTLAALFVVGTGLSFAVGHVFPLFLAFGVA